MNVIQYQNLLKEILQNNPQPELTVPLTDLVLETKDLPITLPKVSWRLLESFETESLQHKHILSSIQLFEEVIIIYLLKSTAAIMAQLIKVGEQNE